MPSSAPYAFFRSEPRSLLIKFMSYPCRGAIFANSFWCLSILSDSMLLTSGCVQRKFSTKVVTIRAAPHLRLFSPAHLAFLCYATPHEYGVWATHLHYHPDIFTKRVNITSLALPQGGDSMAKPEKLKTSFQSNCVFKGRKGTGKSRYCFTDIRELIIFIGQSTVYEVRYP